MLRYIIIIGNVSVCNDIFLFFLLRWCRSPIPLFKMIALQFSFGFTIVWEDNFLKLCASSRLIMVAIWPFWSSKLWILALASCWNYFVFWNCKVLVAKDLTISSKGIPKLEVWPNCCLGAVAAYIAKYLGSFESRGDLLMDSHS